MYTTITIFHLVYYIRKLHEDRSIMSIQNNVSLSETSLASIEILLQYSRK